MKNDLYIAAAGSGIAILCSALCYLGAVYIDSALRRRRRSRPTPRATCGETIATGYDAAGDLHRATCCLTAGHYGDHATTLAALELIGYAQKPF